MRRLIAALAGVGLVAVIAAGAPAAPKEPSWCTPEGTGLSISAIDSKFDKDCLAAPAGEAFTITFNNQEDVPHNVAIYDQANGNAILFKGQVFNGPKTVTYDVLALADGAYQFVCDPHDDKMIGRFVVGTGGPDATSTTTTAPPATTTTTGLLP